MVCIREVPVVFLTVGNRYMLEGDYSSVMNYIIAKNDNGVIMRYARDIFITEQEYRILTINNIINEES